MMQDKDSAGLTATSPLNWFPLATEQLRLRSLSAMSVYHPSCQGSSSDSSFYLTFHETPLSPPIYTSHQSKLMDTRVTWPDLEHKMSEFSGVRSVILRLWRNNTSDDSCESVAVWGVTFSGLVCVGDKIPRQVEENLRENSLVFKLHQHYFVANCCMKVPLVQARFMEVPFITLDSCKTSYDRSSLTKLAATLRALKQIEISNGRVKKEISARLQPGSTVSINSSNSSSSVSSSLRQQIFTVQPKQPATKMTELNLMRRVENTRHRISLLLQERARLRKLRESKKMKHADNVVNGDEVNDSLMESYHALSKDKEKLEAWLVSVQESRDCNIKASHCLSIRRNQLIGQLREIFPIHEPDTPHPTICHVVVPSSEHMKERDEVDLSVGLGWVTHLTSMVSSLLGVPLRNPTTSAGSRSSISDLILDRIPDKEREFPLYAKGVEKVKFEYGIYLLNKNIAQLRWFCDLNTQDLRPTLSNLSSLLDTCCKQSRHVSSHVSPARHQLPAAPSVLAGVSTLSSSSKCQSPVMMKCNVEKSDKTSSSTEDEMKVVMRDVNSEESNDDNDDNSPGKAGDHDSIPRTEDDDDKVICDNNISEIETKPIEDNEEPSSSHVMEYCIETATGYTVENDETANLSNHIEEAVEAADVFWDSVANRTQALAITNTFKRQLTKRPF